MAKLIDIGILGCARIVRRAIAGGIRNSGVARLAAVASQRPGPTCSCRIGADMPTTNSGAAK